ncbi:hypothetical protein V6W11_07540 [Micromonospora profundi]|uniref:hypothetical protein n=1 Tax=Micromonospora profundi TaxID=1420889 RepID=UPI002FF1681F
MAYRTWGKLLLTALGVSVLAGAGQLGVAYGFGIVRLTGAFTGTTVNQWPAQLVWVGWFAANAAVAGAVLTGRLARRDAPAASTGRQLAIGGAAALGATVVAPLCMQPARAAELISVDPVWAVGICAVLGAVIGAGAAIAVLLRPELGWNMAAVAGAVWLLALISVLPSLGTVGPLPTVRLGVLEPSWLDDAAAQRLALLLLPIVALLAGAATAALARSRGQVPLVSGATGVAGPVLVAFAYLTAGPGDAVDRYQATPYYGALIAVLAGALGAAAAALLRWPSAAGSATGRQAIEPTDILRPLAVGPPLPGTTPATSADPAGDGDTTAPTGPTTVGAELAGARPGPRVTDDIAAVRTVPAHWDWPTTTASGQYGPATTNPERTGVSTEVSPPTGTAGDDLPEPAGTATTEIIGSAGTTSTSSVPAGRISATGRIEDTIRTGDAGPVDGMADGGGPTASPATATRDAAQSTGDRALTGGRTTGSAGAETGTGTGTAGVGAVSTNASKPGASNADTGTPGTGAADTGTPGTGTTGTGTTSAGTAGTGASATTGSAGDGPALKPRRTRKPKAAASGTEVATSGTPKAAAPDATDGSAAAGPAGGSASDSTVRASRSRASDDVPSASDEPRAGVTDSATQDGPAVAAAPAASRARRSARSAKVTESISADALAEEGNARPGEEGDARPAGESQATPTHDKAGRASTTGRKGQRAMTVSTTTATAGTSATGPDAQPDATAGPTSGPAIADASNVGRADQPATEAAAGGSLFGTPAAADPGTDRWTPAPPAWPVTSAWTTSHQVGDTATPAPGTSDAPDESTEWTPRPRHRAPLPDLSRVSSWDAFKTARRTGPADSQSGPADSQPGSTAVPRTPGQAARVTDDSDRGAAFETTASAGPGAAAVVPERPGTTDGPTIGDARTSNGDAEQPSRRERLGSLFRRGRSRAEAEKRPGTAAADPLPTQDEEFVDWVAGLGKPVADNDPEQEDGRRSLRSTGRHHRD